MYSMPVSFWDTKWKDEGLCKLPSTVPCAQAMAFAEFSFQNAVSSRRDAHHEFGLGKRRMSRFRALSKSPLSQPLWAIGGPRMAQDPLPFWPWRNPSEPLTLADVPKKASQPSVWKPTTPASSDRLCIICVMVSAISGVHYYKVHGIRTRHRATSAPVNASRR